MIKPFACSTSLRVKEGLSRGIVDKVGCSQEKNQRTLAGLVHTLVPSNEYYITLAMLASVIPSHPESWYSDCADLLHYLSSYCTGKHVVAVVELIEEIRQMRFSINSTPPIF